MKKGDKVNIEGEEWTAEHVTPAVDETCQHEWKGGDEGDPEYCMKCGLSFTRYIFSCFP